MPKRFTATEKWDDPWFRKLKPEFKCFWLYLCDKCDGAGVWKEDMEDVAFRVGQPLTKPSIIMAMEGRVELFEYGIPVEVYWIIPKFLFFQVKELKADYNPHRGIYHSLSKYSLNIIEGLVKPYPSLAQGLQDKNTDKNENKEKLGKESVREKPTNFFELWYLKYPRKKNKGDAEKAWKNIREPAKIADLILKALEWQIVCPDWTKNGGQYIPYPASYINAKGWEDQKQVSFLDKYDDDMNLKEEYGGKKCDTQQHTTA